VNRLKSSFAGVRSRAARTWRQVSRRWTAPAIGERDILDALGRLGTPPAGAVMVHSSLSACGLVRGGASTVIRALRLWNLNGTLAMPAHSYCYPRGTGAAPVFDPAITPSVVGAITDAFWRQPGVLRSLHPTHSLAVEGGAARALIAGHETCSTPCGQGTPYARLVQMDAAVVMFGTTLDAYTLFHTAEDAAGAAYLYEAQPVSLRYREAGRPEQVMSMRKHDMTVTRSFAARDTWLEQRGLLRRTGLGAGELLLLPHAGQVHAAVVAELGRNPEFLTARSAA
jgi:aminoglycoside 3-N-acetyltransferase